MDYLRSLARSSSSSASSKHVREESPISDIDEGEGESKVAIDAGIQNVLDAMNRHNAARAGAQQLVGGVAVGAQEGGAGSSLASTAVVDSGGTREEQSTIAKIGEANAGDGGNQVKDADSSKQVTDDDIVMEDAPDHRDKGKQRALDEPHPPSENDINTPLQQRHEQEQRPPTPELYRGHSRNASSSSGSSSSSSATITGLEPADTVNNATPAAETQRRREASPTPVPEVAEEEPATPPPPPVEQHLPADGAASIQDGVQSSGPSGSQNHASQSGVHTSGQSGDQNHASQSGIETNDSSHPHSPIKYYDEDEDMQVVGENIRSPPLPPPKPETIKINIRDFNGYKTFFSCKPTSKSTSLPPSSFPGLSY